MNGKELLLGLSYISPKYIEEAKNYSASQKRIRFRKPLLIAAVIALTLLLVGCAVAAYARIHMRLVQHNVPTTAQTDKDVSDTTPARSVIAGCYPQQLPALLQNAIQGELAAIGKYRRQAETIQDANIVANLQRIIQDEEHHVRLFRSMLAEVAEP